MSTHAIASRSAGRLAWLALFALTAIVYLAPAGNAVLDDADATHALAAQHMAASGDPVTLKVNGIRYLEKAPLMYWLTALSYRIFGAAEFATHLPLILGTFLLVALATVWGRAAFGARAGIYAGLIAATATGSFLFTRVLIPEVLLSLLLGATLYFFLSALQSRRAWRWYAAYATLALAVLTKGLVALVFVAGAGLLYLVLSGEWRRWREFRLPTGLLLLFAIAAPWHIAAALENPGFAWFYFVNEHFLRFLGMREPKDYNKLPALAYWALHLVWLFPWSLYLPLALRGFRDRLRGADLAARTRLLCWCYAGLILVFFALSTNQEYYTFPVYLPLALLLADALARQEHEQPESRWRLGAHLVLLVIGAAAAAVLAWGLWSSRHLPYVADIGEVLVQRGVGDYTLSMSHFFDLTAEAFAALRLPALLAMVALLAGPVVALLLWRIGRAGASTWAVAATWALMLLAAGLALGRFEPYLSSRPLARALAPELRSGDLLMLYGDQAFGSSLVFYLRRPVMLVNGRSTSMEFGSRYPDAPRIFLDEAGLRLAWRSSQRVFLFIPRHLRAEAERLLPPERILVAESSGKAIYSNR